MLGLSIYTIIAITVVLVFIITYLITRGIFIRKQKVLEEQIRYRIETIEGLEKTIRITQTEKEQFLTRAIKAETQLVMVKVAMAESRETDLDSMDNITVEDVELARQILEVDSKIILSKI